MERLHRHGKSLKNFTYTDKETADGIYSAINSTQFLGVSGHVAFSSQGDRIALTQIEQMIDGKYVKLGYYDTQADNLTWMNEERWIGGKVPQDRTIVRRELRTVSLPLFICMWTVSCLGILCAIGLIVFNILYRHRRQVERGKVDRGEVDKLRLERHVDQGLRLGRHVDQDLRLGRHVDQGLRLGRHVDQGLRLERHEDQGLRLERHEDQGLRLG
uniref:Uncharacterized protein n=1 Tax=Timema genevievae TaxID=629358 RepID=A0A7R9JVP3_TIMGE|nr:unnamed protein product [Timema genevievae]